MPLIPCPRRCFVPLSWRCLKTLCWYRDAIVRWGYWRWSECASRPLVTQPQPSRRDLLRRLRIVSSCDADSPVCLGRWLCRGIGAVVFLDDHVSPETGRFVRGSCIARQYLREDVRSWMCALTSNWRVTLVTSLSGQWYVLANVFVAACLWENPRGWQYALTSMYVGDCVPCSVCVWDIVCFDLYLCV